MTNTELYIPTKVKAGTANDNITIAFRAVERWANNLPTGGGGAYASLTGPGETTTPGDLTQAGGFDASAPSTSSLGIQLNNSSPLGITLADTGGGIELDTHHEIQLNSSTGIQLNPGTTPLGSGFNVEINASQQLNGGTEINGPLQVFDTSPSGIGLSEGGTGGIGIEQLGASSGITIFDSGGTSSGPGGGLFVSSTSYNGLFLGGVGGVAIAAGNNFPSATGQAGTNALAMTAVSDVVLAYSYLTTGVAKGTHNITIGDSSAGGTNSFCHLYTNFGDPNSVVTAQSTGDICFDATTPALWMSLVGGTNNHWHPFTYT